MSQRVEKNAVAAAVGMDLSILRLGSPRRRFASGQFAFDYEQGFTTNTSASATPTTISPRGASGGGAPMNLSNNYNYNHNNNSIAVNEDVDLVFYQQRAAIPFVWEEKPGTPRPGASSIKEESSGSEDEESSEEVSQVSHYSRNSSAYEKNDSSASDFEFNSSETESTMATKLATADELFAKGQILPLKPPPRLQSIKQLMAADAVEDSMMGSFNSSKPLAGSFRKDGLRTPTRSFRIDGIKAFVSSPRREKKGEVTTMLGFEEWPGAGSNPGHRRAHSLTALFRKKHADKENEFDAFGSDFGRRGSAKEQRKPLESIGARASEGEVVRDDEFECSRDWDARSEFFDTSSRIDEEEENEDSSTTQDEPRNAESARQKKQGRLSRFFRGNKPSRLSAVAPTPHGRSEEMGLKRVQQNPLLKLCLSNYVGQALVRGVNHFRSLESQPQRSVSTR